MSKENSRERIIQLVFGTYPEASQFHFTSDNQAFSNALVAGDHAKKLGDNKVELIKRSDLKAKSKDAGDSSAKVNLVATGKSITVPEKKKNDERASLVNRLVELTGKTPRHNTGIPKLKEAIEKAELSAKEADKTTTRTVTQEDLDANPDLVSQGMKVGDEVEIPGE